MGCRAEEDPGVARRRGAGCRGGRGWTQGTCTAAVLATLWLGSGCVVGPEVVGYRPAERAVWPSDVVAGRVSIRGEVAGLVEVGDGPLDLVLLSGLGGSVNEWAELVPLLSDRYRLILVDWPGFGSSPRTVGEAVPERGLGVRRYAEMIPAILDAAGVERCLLVGHSMGGHIVAYHASEPGGADARVMGLVLISPSGLGQSFSNERLDQLARDRDLLIELGTHFARWNLLVDELSPLLRRLRDARNESDKSIVWDESTPEARRYLELTLRGVRSILASREAKAYVAALADAAISIRQNPMQDRLGAIALPTLVIGGVRDRVVPAVYHTRYAQGIRSSREVSIADCGHSPQVECAGIVAAAMDGFVRFVQSAEYSPGSGRGLGRSGAEIPGLAGLPAAGLHFQRDDRPTAQFVRERFARQAGVRPESQAGAGR